MTVDNTGEHTSLRFASRLRARPYLDRRTNGKVEPHRDFLLSLFSFSGISTFVQGLAPRVAISVLGAKNRRSPRAKARLK